MHVVFESRGAGGCNFLMDRSGLQLFVGKGAAFSEKFSEVLEYALCGLDVFWIAIDGNVLSARVDANIE